MPNLVQAECIATLYDETDFYAGKTYELDREFMQAHPLNFREVGTAPKPHAQVTAEDKQRQVEAGQQRYETFRQNWDHQEVQSDIARAAERKRRAEEAQRQADEVLREVEDRAKQVPVPEFREEAPTQSVPAIAPPTSIAPGGRAERLRQQRG